jgi:predicted LPLAT superfamily acyltransferase
MMAMVRLLPNWFLRLFAFPVSFFYATFSGRARRESKRFLDRLNAVDGVKKHTSTYRHIASFALSLVEKAEAWSGKILQSAVRYHDDDIESFVKDIEEKNGAVLLCSHLGNADMLRALADFGRTRAAHKFPVVSIVDFSVTAGFNRMIEELNPGYTQRLISANNIGMDTVWCLQECLDAGGIVVIAGDRTGAQENRDREFTFDFLGKSARFPMGPFFLVSLLKVNAYFVFGLRQKTLSLDGKYDMRVYKSGITFDCPRSERNKRIEELARSYVLKLEELCKATPYQWYNFYDFWEEQDG